MNTTLQLQQKSMLRETAGIVSLHCKVKSLQWYRILNSLIRFLYRALYIWTKCLFLGGLSCSLSWFCFTQWRSIFLIVLAYLWTWRERCWLQTTTDSCSASVCVEMWWVLMFLILPTVNKQPEIRSPGSFIHALSLAGTTRGRALTG